MNASNKTQLDMSIVVDFQWVVEADNVPSETDIQHWVECVVLEHQDEAELTVRVVDEDEITQLNHQYRKKHKATNVLSFPVEADLPVEIPLLGDLVICASVVAQEAAQQGKLLNAHWAHMVIHGTLHLLGYDHIEAEQAQMMEDKEIKYLHEFNFSNPYEVTAHS